MNLRLLFCLFIVCFSSIFFLSCSSPKALEYQSFNQLKIRKLGATFTTISFNLVYYNPNQFGLQLKNTDLDIYINDNFLGHTMQEYQINIPKRSSFSLPILIDVDMKNAYKNGFSALLGKVVLVKVVGKVKVGKANIYKNLNVNYVTKEKFTF